MRRQPPLSPNAWLRWGLFTKLVGRIPELHSILEVGCGRGAMGYRFALTCQYRGYEPDSRSFWTAQERMRHVEQAQVVNAVVPACPDRKFDLLVASEVLEHIDDDKGALSRWAEWLEPDGYVLVSVPANPNRFGIADRAVGHFRRYTRGDLEDLLGAAGFEPLEVWVYGFPLGYLLEFARNRMARREADRARSLATAVSGRWHQPPERIGLLVRIGTAPFRLVQTPFIRSSFGTGFVALGKRIA